MKEIVTILHKLFQNIQNFYKTRMNLILNSDKAITKKKVLQYIFITGT